MSNKPTHFVALSAEAIAASTPYVLIDLSDVTNFPHSETAEIQLHKVRLATEKAAGGVYDIWLGVVTENDATDGSVTWIHCWHLQSLVGEYSGTDRFNDVQDFEGLSLRVSGGSLQEIVSNSTQANSANWQNDVGLASPAGAGAGATGKPGAGDLVVWVEEVSDVGTLDMFISAQYK